MYVTYVQKIIEIFFAIRFITIWKARAFFLNTSYTYI